MVRPTHLPDFINPPLDEVVLGVQFNPAPGFTSLNNRDVWDLFRQDFPIVQEQPLLPPQFETFGGINAPPAFQFQFGIGPTGSRLWFVTQDGNHLLQFQPDRFLSNWRSNGGVFPYPRYEAISAEFQNRLSILQRFFAGNFSHKVDVNQAEVSYINLIPVDDFSEFGKWFRFSAAKDMKLESLHIAFSEVLKDDAGKPQARLSHVIQSAYSVDGRQKAFNLSISVRGKPKGNDIDSAMAFLARSREAIVTAFKDITTDEAHAIWGRTQ